MNSPIRLFPCFLFAICLCSSLSAAPLPAQTPRPRATGGGAQLKAQADQARETGNLDAAIPLYRRALAVQPAWAEGWWYLATLLYERDQYAEAARAFQRTVALQPRLGAPQAMLGLCEFRLNDYDNALKHLRQGLQIGLGENQDLPRVVRYHEALLLLLKGDFETAQSLMRALSYDNMNHEDLLLAHGLAALRLPMQPRQIAPDYRDRDVIRRTGLAEHLASQLNAADAQQEFERLTGDYPKTPNLQYALGQFLLRQRNDEGALTAFQQEVATSPSHALARLQIAYIHLRNKDPEAGLKLTEEAIRLHPRLPLGHYILGRILYETGDNARSITELETARRLAPNEPRVHFALSRSYTKAGRRAEAEQARETFTRLNKIAEESAAAGQPRGDAIDETGESKKPEQ